jgi:hypothetical protein
VLPSEQGGYHALCYDQQHEPESADMGGVGSWKTGISC